jgi:hypothetical protein
VFEVLCVVVKLDLAGGCSKLLNPN